MASLQMKRTNIKIRIIIDDFGYKPLSKCAKNSFSQTKHEAQKAYLKIKVRATFHVNITKLYPHICKYI